MIEWSAVIRQKNKVHIDRRLTKSSSTSISHSPTKQILRTFSPDKHKHHKSAKEKTESRAREFAFKHHIMNVSPQRDNKYRIYSLHSLHTLIAHSLCLIHRRRRRRWRRRWRLSSAGHNAPTTHETKAHTHDTLERYVLWHLNERARGMPSLAIAHVVSKQPTPSKHHHHLICYIKSSMKRSFIFQLAAPLN